MESLTKQQHINAGDYVFSYDNEDYKWIKDGVEHLVGKDGIEKCSGDSVYSYGNGDYEWKKDGIAHLVGKDGVEKCSGDYVHSYDNGDYKWKKDGVVHLVGKDGVEYLRAQDGTTCLVGTLPGKTGKTDVINNLEELKNLSLKELENTSKEELQKGIKLAKDEIAEWEAFINLLEIYLNKK